MNRTIVIHFAGVSRTVSADDLPIAVGGDSPHLPLPGSPASPVAHVGIADGTLFIQPSGRGEALLVNGSPITASTWVYPGDTIDAGFGRISINAEGETLVLTASVPDRDAPTDPPESASPTDPPHDEHPAVIVTPVAFTPSAGGSRPNARWRPHPVSVALALFLALAAVTLWFVLTARTVTIEISPRPTTVTLKGGPVRPNVGGRYLLVPGDYRLEAEHSDFRRLEVDFTVTDASNQIFRFDLDPLPGILSVVTDPPLPAVVEVDGRHAGTTPLAGVELTQGDHEVVVRADRHQVFTTTVSIDEPGGRRELSVALVPAWATVTIGSQPAGAAVAVDGVFMGTTPLAAELGAGSHRVELQLDGYKRHRTSVEVEPNRPLSLPAVRLEPADAVLVVRSEPPGATVTVDGAFAGQTPMELAVEPSGGHDVKISKTGHRTHVASVAVAAGTSESLEVVLEPMFGEVQIVSTPGGAEIIIDGEPAGHTTATLLLPAVSHTLALRKEGFSTFTTTVLPEEGLAQTVRATLEPVQARPDSAPTTVTTSQGARLVRINAGKVLMGASRREPGRRANESLREVEITRPFLLAVHEVTNQQFREFAPDHDSGQAGGMSLAEADQPVVGVTWNDAVRYCNWLSEREGLPPVYVERGGRWIATPPFADGYRLPTEAEWVLAARMAGGSSPKKYIWGHQLPPPGGAGNYGDASASRILDGSLPDYKDGFAVTAPVGSFDANPLGIFDLGGNVSEWVHDAYTIYPPSPGGVIRDPTGPSEGEYHVIRGAGWMDTQLTRLRLSYRDYGNHPAPDVGFRIARNAR